MDGVKVEIPGVDVQGTLKPGNLFETLAAMLSIKFDKCVVIVTHSNELAKSADAAMRLRKGELQISDGR